jgi:hypothetical protein
MKESIQQHIGGCTNTKCKCRDKNSPFIELEDREVFIFDDDAEGKEQPCHLVGREDNHQITVVNQINKPFTFVKFDACIITDEKKRCDALVYSQEQFYFLEIKDTTVKGRRNARKEAIKQLAASIQRFENIDFKERELFAVIGFANPKRWVTDTASKTEQVRFLQNYGVKLKEGQTIVLRD